MTFITNVITTPAETQLSAFGRLRVAEPYTIIDTNHVFDINNIEEASKVTGAGTITLNANNPSVDMVLTGSGTLIKQTRHRGIYQPSKSLSVFMTGVINSGSNGTGVTSRIGYFDASDGLYFEHRGDGTTTGTMYVTLRTSSSGTLVNNEIIQSSWNFDTMDGTGPSGITFDPSKTQIFHFDMEWLGVGLVRASIIANGKYHIVHKFRNSNINPIVYMNTASQPVRYEISSTGATGSLNKICNAVVLEGGAPPIGRVRSVSTYVTSTSVSSGTLIPIISIRKKSTMPKISVSISDISIITSNNVSVFINILIFRDLATSARLTGASWVTDSSDTSVEYDISSTAITTTDSYQLASGHITTATRSFTFDFTNTRDAQLTSNIDGLSAFIVVCGRSLSSSSAVNASIGYAEKI